jgi:flagellar motor switch protein FliM
MHLPLARLGALQVGETLTLPGSALDETAIVGVDGHPVAMGRLGQSVGQRAVRLHAEDGASAPGAAQVPAAAPAAHGDAGLPVPAAGADPGYQTQEAGSPAMPFGEMEAPEMPDMPPTPELPAMGGLAASGGETADDATLPDLPPLDALPDVSS